MDLLKECSSSQNLIDKILSCVQACMVVIDLEGKVLSASPAVEKVLGFTPIELHGKGFSVVFTPEDLRYLYPNLLYMARKNEPFQGEVMLKRKNGTRFFALLLSLTCMDPSQGKPTIVVYIQDIDKLKQQEKVLRETNYDDLVKVADGIAHELRNPLVGIAGFVNKLYRACKAVPGGDKYYNYIMDNLYKIEALVKGVEFFAHLPKPCFVEESVKEVIDDAIQDYRQQMKELKIDLAVSVDETTLFMDADLVKQAFSILIKNALDALNKGGSITVNSQTKGNQCKISVTDTGSGILPKHIPYVFDPFFSTKPDGIGISLGVVKRIMNIHGGNVKVKSKQGKGTTFFLIFPVERRRPIRVSLLG